MSTITRCERCNRQLRCPEGWNAVLSAGVITGLIWPSCQTAEENAEAAINDATLVYGRDPEGLHAGRPRIGSGA